MKNLNKKILINVFGVAYLLALVLLPLANLKIAYAEQEPASIVILSSDYDYPDKSSFTPFNFSTNSRLAGYSGRFNYDEFERFEQNFSINAVDGLSANKSWELGVWVYFSTKNLHDLTITLAKDEDKKVTFFINSEDLANLLTKQDEFGRLDQENDGYAWNYLELPFSAGAITNAISGAEFANFDTVSFKFWANQPSESVNYARVYIYNATIFETELNSITVQEKNKQDFRLFDINFYSKEILDSVFVSDELTLSGRQELIKFAWVGESDLKDDFNYSVAATFNTPNGEENWELEGKKTMLAAGQASLKISIKNGSQIVLVRAVNFTVYNFTGIAFNQTITEFNPNKTICIVLTKNSKSSNLSDLRFTISGDCAKIKEVDEANLKVYIETTATGKFTLSAEAVIDRPLKEGIEVTASKEFSVVAAKQNKDNTPIIIVLSSILAVAGVIGLGFGIKAIIKANRYKVR